MAFDQLAIIRQSRIDDKKFLSFNDEFFEYEEAEIEVWELGINEYTEKFVANVKLQTFIEQTLWNWAHVSRVDDAIDDAGMACRVRSKELVILCRSTFKN